MKTTQLAVLAIAAAMTAHADFSYTQTRKTTQGSMGMAGGPQTTKHFLKGQKMRVDIGNDNAVIIDFDAQTLTSINNATKTYSVKKFSEMGQAMGESGVEVKLDVKETGQKKVINGFNSSELLMTMDIDSADARQSGMKMQMEISTWISPDVPGAQELRAFYQKNGARIPWAAIAGQGANPGMAKGIADMQRKLAGMGGVPVLQVVRTKAGGAGAPQITPAQQQQMAQARAQMEAMAKQGGPAAAAAQQALGRMGAVPGAGGGGVLFEISNESSGFSTNSIPDSVFQVPSGYTMQ